MAGFAPSDGDSSSAGSLRRLWRHISVRRRRQVFGILIFMLIGAGAELATIGSILPFLTLLAAPQRATSSPFFQAILNTLGVAPSNLLIFATAAFITIAISAAAIRLALLWSSQRFVFRIGYELSVQMYDTLLHQNYSYHVARNSSEMLSGLQKCSAVTTNYLLPIMQTVISVTLAVFIVAALAYANPLIAFSALASFGGIYFLVSLPARKILRRNGKVIAGTQSARIRTVQEGLGGIRDVLLDRAQPLYLRKFAKLDSEFRDAQATSSYIGQAPRFIVESMGMIVIALLAVFLSRGQGGLLAALPMLGALAIGAQKLLPLLQQIYSGWAQMAVNRAILDDVLDFLEQPLERSDPKHKPLPFHEDIELRSLGFSYQPNSAAVLNNVSLRIPRGATVGFVGKTGSGKSTLIDIVMGLLAPIDGDLIVDGVPIKGKERARWQMNIAHVPQAIFLSDATIAENIAFGVDLKDIDMVKVRAAAERAHIAEHVDALPEGYFTFVGERGTRLSGGQRQRVGIARALYKQSALLVLDEATSALDEQTEAGVMKSIEALGDELTVIIVAHRLSTLRNCSIIYRLDQGKIIQRGSFQQVIAPQELVDATARRHL